MKTTGKRVLHWELFCASPVPLLVQDHHKWQQFHLSSSDDSTLANSTRDNSTRDNFTFCVFSWKARLSARPTFLERLVELSPFYPFYLRARNQSNKPTMDLYLWGQVCRLWSHCPLVCLQPHWSRPGLWSVRENRSSVYIVKLSPRRSGVAEMSELSPRLN